MQLWSVICLASLAAAVTVQPDGERTLDMRRFGPEGGFDTNNNIPSYRSKPARKTGKRSEDALEKREPKNMNWKGIHLKPKPIIKSPKSGIIGIAVLQRRDVSDGRPAIEKREPKRSGGGGTCMSLQCTHPLPFLRDNSRKAFAKRSEGAIEKREPRRINFRLPGTPGGTIKPIGYTPPRERPAVPQRRDVSDGQHAIEKREPKRFNSGTVTCMALQCTHPSAFLRDKSPKKEFVKRSEDALMRR